MSCTKIPILCIMGEIKRCKTGTPSVINIPYHGIVIDYSKGNTELLRALQSWEGATIPFTFTFCRHIDSS